MYVALKIVKSAEHYMSAAMDEKEVMTVMAEGTDEGQKVCCLLYRIVLLCVFIVIV